MSIESSCSEVVLLLDRIKRYNTIVRGDSLTPDTINEMKTKGKDFADDAKSKLETIKDEIDTWGS